MLRRAGLSILLSLALAIGSAVLAGFEPAVAVDDGHVVGIVHGAGGGVAAEPTITVSAPATGVAGLSVRASASSDSSLTGIHWSADKDCLVGTLTSATVTVQCPAALTGPVEVTATVGEQSAHTTITMSAPDAVSTLDVYALGAAPGDDSPYQMAWTIEGHVAQDGTLRRPLRALMVLESTTDDPTSPTAIWTTVPGTGVVEDDGDVFVEGLIPERRTTYRLRVPGTSAPEKQTTLSAIKRITALSIGINQSDYPTRIGGRLTSLGSPLAGRVVRLQLRWVGTSTWHTVRTLTTSSTGRVATTYSLPAHAADFRFVYGGSSRYAKTVSNTRRGKVQTVFSSGARSGSPDLVVGILRDHAGHGVSGQGVRVQMLTSYGWRTLAIRHTSSTGRVTYLNYRFAHDRRFRFVYPAPRDSSYLSSVSPSRLVH